MTDPEPGTTSARRALGCVAALVLLELLLIMIVPVAGRWTDAAVAWYDPVRRIAPIASMFSESQSLGARTLLLVLGFVLVAVKAALVAMAASRARRSRDVKDFVHLPSDSSATVASRIASGVLLALFATMLVFFVLGFVLNSGSERSAIFIMMRVGGFKYWLVWHAGFFTLLSGVLGLFAFWVWDALQGVNRAVVR